MAGPDKKNSADETATGFIPALVAVLITGSCAGFGFGWLTVPRMLPAATIEKTVSADKRSAERAAQARLDDSAAKPSGDPLQAQILSLEPIIVNIAGPGRTWLRLEGAVALSAPLDKDRERLLAEIVEDLVGFLRGTSLSQIQSAVGLEFLREDLTELVRLRSKGRINRFLLRSLVVE